MPFTISHPALVLPLTYLPKRWYSLTGLIIGSLVPDFEYFIRMKIQSNYSHTLAGLLWFDIPLGVVIAFIYHLVVRDNLIDNLPRIIKSRLWKFKQFNWKNYFIENWFVVIISIFSGAASHLFWDSFTHPRGYFAQTIPFLMNKIEIIGKQISILKIFQHLSTLIGMLVIVFVLWKLPQDRKVNINADINYLISFTIITLSILSIRLLTGLDFRQYGNLIATGISGGIIALTLTPFIIRRK